MDKLMGAVSRVYRKKFPSKTFAPGETCIPVSGKVFDEEEMKKMVEAVMDGHWTEGRFNREFEVKLADFVGVAFCATVNSGSSANLLSLAALTSSRLPENKRLSKGDAVITAAAGFPTTINPIIQCGMLPILVDVKLGSYNSTVDQIAEAVDRNRKKVKAVFLAHTLGNPFDLEQIKKICEEQGLWLIEDNCDALGSRYRGRLTGSFGHLSTVSFYPAHHITTGEGGAVFTNDPLLNKIVRSLRDWGRDCHCPTGIDNTCGRRFQWTLGNLPMGYDHKYVYSECGFNLKTTDLQAALGLVQLKKFPEFIRKRKENFGHLYGALREYENFFVLPVWDKNAEPNWFGFPLTVRDGVGFSRSDILDFLNKKKIQTRLLFAGNITRQPYFLDNRLKYKVCGKLKNCDVIMNNTFWIGVYQGLNKEMLDFVIHSFKDFFKR